MEERSTMPAPAVRALVGTVAALYRFPVKSMGGESLERATLYWHGIEGDRRQVFVKSGDLSTFPWLTARDVPDLVRYRAYLANPDDWRHSPVLVRPPDGPELPVESTALREMLEWQYGAPLHLMRNSHGVHDAAGISLIGLASLRALGERIGQPLDVRRFRENIYLETLPAEPYVEDDWIGRTMIFGDNEGAARVRLLRPDHRCMIVNLDPDHPGQNPAILREIAGSRNNCLGLYGAVEAIGPLQVGAPVYLA
jgi:uncharacterized protein YcbX